MAQINHKYLERISTLISDNGGDDDQNNSIVGLTLAQKS